MDVVRAYLLAAPGEAGPASAVDQVIARVRGPEAEAAMADAAVALARFATRDPGALDRARKLVTQGVAARLVERLATAEGPRRGELAELLTELGAPVRSAALEALRTAGAGGGGGEDGGLPEGVASLVAPLARSDPALLQELLQDADWRIVRWAIGIASERGGDDAVQRLTVALDHGDSRVRAAAVASLRALGGGEAGELAVRRLGDGDPGVRTEAARAVGTLNIGRGLGSLLERLDTEDHPDTVLALIRSLGTLGDPLAVPELERWATGSVPGRSTRATRSAACRALQLIDSARARAVLAALDEGDPDGAGSGEGSDGGQ
ncbi:MAG: HEAT repeat domain-containing protein [Gemmatimonadota bacterium]